VAVIRDSKLAIWPSGATARPARIEQAMRPPMVRLCEAIRSTPTTTTPA
jgi:hypothetical protein